MLRTTTVLLLLVAIVLLAGCDNVGRAFDPILGNPNPPNGQSTSNIQVPPVGGDLRDGRPIVRAAYPKGGGWPRSVPIVVEFSESMNEASIAPTTVGGLDGKVVVRLQGTTQALPAGYDFLANGRLLIIRPAGNLDSPSGTAFEVAMLPGVRDADGLTFSGTAEQILATFTLDTTSTSEDGGILAVYPRDNVRDVSTDTDYIVVFTKAPNATPFASQSNFLVRTSGGTAVAGLPDAPLQPADTRVVLFHSANGAELLPGTTYELVVTAGITFGTAGVLRFSNRTPFARFTTANVPQPLAVKVGNPTSGFDDKVNIDNLPILRMAVDLPAAAAAGDRVLVRVYGSDRSTQATGDLAFAERTADVVAAGVQTVNVDFTNQIGSVGNPKFDDGALSFVAQLQRGTAHSGVVRGSAAGRQDTVRPTLTSLGPPTGANGTDLFCELQDLVVFGTASEQLGDVLLTVGGTPVHMYASRANGTFLTAPVHLGHTLSQPTYSLAIFDLAGNEAAASAQGQVFQRGLITGDGTAGDVTVAVYDEATLRPVAGATVFVDDVPPAVPAPSVRPTLTTDANGRADFTGLTTGNHTVTVVQTGFDLVTMYDTAAGFVSLPLRHTSPASSLAAVTGTATLDGTLANATAIVSSNLIDDATAASISTLSTAPTVIPPTAILPNRLQVVTAFGGNFEPTANPTFAFHACNLLTGTQLETAAPPTAPVAAAASSVLNLLLRSRGGSASNLALLTGAAAFDFATTGLNSNQLSTRTRITTALDGFLGQVDTGIGFATPTTPGGSIFDATGSYSTAIVDGLSAFAPRTWLMVQAQDDLQQFSRIRRHVNTSTGGADEFVAPQFVPGFNVPTGPFVGVPPLVQVFDSIDAGAITTSGVPVLGVMEIVALDGQGRRWRLLAGDTDAGTNPVTINDYQWPDPAPATGLANGTWIVRAIAHVFHTAGGGADNYLLADLRHEELALTTSQPWPYLVQ